MKRQFGSPLLLLLVTMGLAACGLLYWITPLGVGVSPDSTVYLAAAKSLLSGAGYLASGRPVTHYPPLYPILLAGAGILQTDLVQAARLLNALVLGTNVALIGCAVSVATARNYPAVATAGLIFVLSAPVLTLHAMAWSEPLFIVFSLCSLILLSVYLENRPRSLLIASSLSLGLAVLTRYIGLALIPAAVVIVLAGTDRQQLGHRIRDALSLLLIACTPVAAFLVRNIGLTGSAANRPMAFHPVSSGQLKGSATAVLAYVFPIPVPFGMGIAIIGILVSVLVLGLVIVSRHFLTERRRPSLALRLTFLSLLFSASYLLFLLISITFFDAYTPPDTRLLSPAFAFLLVAVWGIAWQLSEIWRGRLIRACLATCVLLFLLIRIPDTVASAGAIQKNGRGYTSRSWQESATVSFVRSIPRGTRIYSNGADVIRFLAGRPALAIPVKVSPVTMETNDRYDEQLIAMCDDVSRHRAMLVYFRKMKWRWYLPSQEDIETTCALPVSVQLEDGTVYGEIPR